MSFALSIFMCGLNVKYSSNIKPRYLITELGNSFFPFNLTLIKGILVFFFLKYINSVFDVFKDAFFNAHQILKIRPTFFGQKKIYFL